MTKKNLELKLKLPDEDDEALPEGLEEELYGHKITCSCDEDPDWCMKHGGFGAGA